MKPEIDATDFGSITIDHRKIHHDIYIGAEGAVYKRKKKLSKRVYGTSHIISLDEASYVYDPEANEIIIGSGQDDMVKLSREAADFFDEKKCKVKLLPTPEAIRYWNRYEGHAVGLFHVTC
jgi:hypothetical protein